MKSQPIWHRNKGIRLLCAKNSEETWLFRRSFSIKLVEKTQTCLQIELSKFLEGVLGHQGPGPSNEETFPHSVSLDLKIIESFFCYMLRSVLLRHEFSGVITFKTLLPTQEVLPVFIFLCSRQRSTTATTKYRHFIGSSLRGCSHLLQSTYSEVLTAYAYNQ